MTKGQDEPLRRAQKVAQDTAAFLGRAENARKRLDKSLRETTNEIVDLFGGEDKMPGQQESRVIQRAEKLLQETTVVLQGKVMEFRKQFEMQTTILCTDEAAEFLTEALAQIDDKDEWSEDDYIKNSAITFLMAIGLAGGGQG